jgi:hypothetical protein
MEPLSGGGSEHSEAGVVQRKYKEIEESVLRLRKTPRAAWI